MVFSPDFHRPPIGRLLIWQRGRNILLDSAVEEGKHLIILAMGDGVILVRVTPGAAHRKPHKDQTCGISPVDDLLNPVFLRIDSSFRIGQRVAVKSGGHPLLNRSSGKQIPRQLLQDKLIIREVSIIGVDDPLPVTPGVGTRIVLLKSVAVGITGQIQPMPGPALSEVR